MLLKNVILLEYYWHKILIIATILSFQFMLFLWDNASQKLRIPSHFVKCKLLIHTLLQKWHLQTFIFPLDHPWMEDAIFKGCVCYICASLFFLSLNKSTFQTRKNFLFHFKSSFRSCENQILEFYIFKFHGIIKCLSIKQEIHFTE